MRAVVSTRLLVHLFFGVLILASCVCRLQELEQEAAIPRWRRRLEGQVGEARAQGEETERPNQVR